MGYITGLPKRTCIPSNLAFAPNLEVALQLNIEPPLVEATTAASRRFQPPLSSLDSTGIYTQKHRLFLKCLEFFINACILMHDVSDVFLLV